MDGDIILVFARPLRACGLLNLTIKVSQDDASRHPSSAFAIYQDVRLCLGPSASSPATCLYTHRRSASSQVVGASAYLPHVALDCGSAILPLASHI
ncbi:hypothetical protein R1flu_010850 [Riccia fluitans]|uniref:Uncharacterized protein n=1 Tax=Riccia fluitans TaxID=41844 RepID=A0ABD1Z727_9MARC